VDGDTQSIANSNRLNPAFRDLVLLNSTSDFTLSFANKRKASTNIRVERASTSNPLALGTYLFRVVYMFQESSDQDEPLDVTLVYNQSISVVPEYHIVVNGAPADAESFPLSYGQKLSLMLNVISRSKYSIVNTKYTLISENSDFPEYFTLSVDSDGNSVLVWQENAPPPVSDYKLVVSANVTASVDDGELCSHTVQATVTVNVFPRISSIEGNLLNNTAVRISWNVNGSGNGSVNYTITIQEPKNTIRLYTTNMYMVVSPLPHIPSTVEVGVVTDTAAGTTTGSEQFILDTTALRPDPPFNVKAVINPNDVTLTVSWEPSSYAGSINYTVIVRTVATGLLQFQAGSVTMFVIEDIGLKAMTIKSISVKAKNIIGISEESTGVTRKWSLRSGVSGVCQGCVCPTSEESTGVKCKCHQVGMSHPVGAYHPVGVSHLSSGCIPSSGCVPSNGRVSPHVAAYVTYLTSFHSNYHQHHTYRTSYPVHDCHHSHFQCWWISCTCPSLPPPLCVCPLLQAWLQVQTQDL
jgi:hypothetical protein